MATKIIKYFFLYSLIDIFTVLRKHAWTKAPFTAISDNIFNKTWRSNRDPGISVGVSNEFYANMHTFSHACKQTIIIILYHHLRDNDVNNNRKLVFKFIRKLV